MPTSKEIREKRVPLSKQIRQMADKANAENRDFTAEEKGQWETVNKEYNDLSRQIELVERAEKVESDQERPGGDPRVGRDDFDGGKPVPEEKGKRNREECRGLALQAWMRAQLGKPLRKTHVEACRMLRLNPNQRKFDVRLPGDYDAVRRHVRARRLGEQRALSAVQGTAGAFTVPEGFINQIESAMLAYGPMWEVSDVIRTDSGNPIPWPTSDDTSNEGAEIGESIDVTEQDVTFGQVLFGAHKYTSKLIRVPSELLEDSVFDLANWLGDKLGERVGRITNRRFTTGTGGNQPRGVVTDATLGKTAASATAIAADEVFDLLHSVDPAYRPESQFMCHDNIILVLRKLKDSQNRYLWQESMRVGEPEQLLGYELRYNQHMASSVATTNKTLLFGQFKKYKVRQVRTIRLRRLVERYAERDQEGFVGFIRVDGKLLDAGVAPIKYLQQA